MAEIIINSVSAFDKGFVLESSQTLIPGTGPQYTLNINDGINTIIKYYNPLISNKVIIDSWGTIIPINGNVSFTLSTYTPPCNPPFCNFVVS